MKPGLYTVTMLVLSQLALSVGLVIGAEASELSSHVFELEYKVTGQFHHRNVDHLKDQADFEKEPDYTGGNVVKGLIPAGGKEEEYIGYACDLGAGRLYLDLNRNKDLTDDANGVFKTSRPGRGYFDDVRFTVKAGSLEMPCVTGMGFSGRRYAYMNIRSGFSGEFEIGGRKWHFEVKDNLDGKIGGGDNFVLDSRGEGGRALQGLGSLGIHKNVFLGGRLYKTSFEFREGDDRPFLQMRLTELEAPLGNVRFEGKFVKCVVIDNGTTLVVLDRAASETMVPVGSYRFKHLVLDAEGSGRFRVTDFEGGHEFSVSADEPVILKAGGPLTNSVDVERSGGTLTLKYRLVDSIGNEYASINNRRDNPPVFAVYKGDKQVGSGKFEYG
jgi:hypothetical protein